MFHFEGESEEEEVKSLVSEEETEAESEVEFCLSWDQKGRFLKKKASSSSAHQKDDLENKGSASPKLVLGWSQLVKVSPPPLLPPPSPSPSSSPPPPPPPPILSPSPSPSRTNPSVVVDQPILKNSREPDSSGPVVGITTAKANEVSDRIEQTRYTKIIGTWARDAAALCWQKKIIHGWQSHENPLKLERYLTKSWQIQHWFHGSLYHVKPQQGRSSLHCWLNVQLQWFTLWHRAVVEFCFTTLLSHIKRWRRDLNLWQHWNDQEWADSWMFKIFDAVEQQWQEWTDGAHVVETCPVCQSVSSDRRLCVKWPCLPETSLLLL
jgi:hypothetical protein